MGTWSGCRGALKGSWDPETPGKGTVHPAAAIAITSAAAIASVLFIARSLYPERYWMWSSRALLKS